MKMIYRFILILLLCLPISCSAALSQSNLNNSENKCSFTFYSDHLSKLYSEIEKFVEPCSKAFDEEEGQLLVDGVSTLITNYVIKNKLCITDPPLVQIFKLRNNKNKAYVLKVEIRFFDKKESFKDLINTVIFTKKFLIYFGYKKTGVGI
jgi:hypothetical protein